MLNSKITLGVSNRRLHNLIFVFNKLVIVCFDNIIVYHDMRSFCSISWLSQHNSANVKVCSLSLFVFLFWCNSRKGQELNCWSCLSVVCFHTSVKHNSKYKCKFTNQTLKHITSQPHIFLYCVLHVPHILHYVRKMQCFALCCICCTIVLACCVSTLHKHTLHQRKVCLRQNICIQCHWPKFRIWITNSPDHFQVTVEVTVNEMPSWLLC